MGTTTFGARIWKRVYSKTVTMLLLRNTSFPSLAMFTFLIFSAFFPVVVSSPSSTLTIPPMQWINLGTRLSGSAPVGLKDFGIGYYKDTNTMIIFGGTTATGSKNDQTYLANFNHMTWSTPSNTHGAPQARSDMLYGMDIWSSYRNTFVVSCGEGDGNAIFNDTWAFDMNYFTWTQITNVQSMSGPLPPLYSAIGGIDTTTQTGSQVTPNNTMWMSHGTNGTNFFTDLWAQVFSGSWTPNENTLSTVWYKVPAGGQMPQGRKEPAGTILPGGRLAMYGGCNESTTDCAIPDASSLVLGSNYDSGLPTSVTGALWSSEGNCLGSREDSAMAMVGNSGISSFSSQVVVFGGKLPNDTPIGVPGEVGIMDTSSGVWVRAIPQDDGGSLPNIRAGARMIATGKAILPSNSNSVTDILVFGGEALNGSSTYFNDLWILRLYINNSTSEISPSNVTSMKFLDCLPITQANGSPSGDGNSDDGSNGNASISKSHFLLSTLSYIFLSIATTILRFGYGVVSIWSIGGIYGALIVASYATAFYGFAVAFEDKHRSHFSTAHDILGLLILVVLYVFIPILVMVSLVVNKRSGSHASSTSPGESSDRGDGGGGGGGIGDRISAFLNLKSLEGNKSPKSFEVNRAGNKSFHPNEGDSPVSTFKPASDSWVEKRKSVTESAAYNTSSRNSRRISQSTSASHHRLGSNGTPLTGSSANNSSGNLHQPKQNSLATLITQIYYVVFHFVLLLTGIYLLYLFKANSVNGLFFYLLLIFMIVMYASWIILAWTGYPRNKGSLLVRLMANVASGRGEFEDREDPTGESESEDMDSRIINYNPGTGAPHRDIINEEDEMDEETKQAELEQEITNRDVMVMTIPKRRLTVVNA